MLFLFRFPGSDISFDDPTAPKQKEVIVFKAQIADKEPNHIKSSTSSKRNITLVISNSDRV